MALNIKIDFNNCYDIEWMSEDLRISRFETELVDGGRKLIQVSIDNNTLDLLPDVHNLAFGPLNENGEIDDEAILTHKDYSKMFSTIMSIALRFLKANSNKSLGLDGSTDSRAYLYFRIIQNNYEVLTRQFDVHGIKLYARILRSIDGIHPFDQDDIKSYSTEITKGESIRRDKMYNYFTFKIK